MMTAVCKTNSACPSAVATSKWSHPQLCRHSGDALCLTG